LSSPPPVIAPYQPPPSTPPPVAAHSVVTDGKAISALVFGILGLVFAIPLGVPGLIAGPIAYFLGKGAKQRIAESNGSLSGAGAANAGRILGIAATAAGAVVTLVYLIVLFNALLDVGSQTGF
jgi:hypothetical protein